MNATSYTNCSGTAERILVRGTNATSSTSSTTWSLTSDLCPTLNQFKYGVGGDAGGFAISNDDGVLDPSAPSTEVGVNTTLTMPCVGSDGAGETMTWSVIFTATF